MEPAPGAAMLASLETSRQHFLSLVQDVRADLHRYCARMTGSVADGEDVVQDTLAIAYFQLPEFAELPPLRPWLFRIAHNRAIDHHRRAVHRAAQPLDDAADVPASAAAEPEEILATGQAVRAAVSVFLALPPAQRACVILADVLECSLEEIGGHLEMSVPAVKAALHRGRKALQLRMDLQPPVRRTGGASPALQRYVALFNAHDWDGVRAMLADDVRLDLVARRQASGAVNVGTYFSNYARTPGWRLASGWLEQREVAVVYGQDDALRPGYFIEVEFADQRVVAIRDYRHVPYIGRDASFEE